jgi:hypothetical protein
MHTKKQENMVQSKEQNKSPETISEEIQVSNLPVKDF